MGPERMDPSSEVFGMADVIAGKNVSLVPSVRTETVEER